MKLEIGQPNTRTAGMVREPDGEWRQPSLQEQFDLLKEKVDSLEAFKESQRDRLRIGAAIGPRRK
jgi:hypothetical protein